MADTAAAQASYPFRAIWETSWWACSETVAGVNGLIHLRQEFLSRPDPDEWVTATEADLRSTLTWATTLLKLLNQHDPLKIILAVEEDCLGVYQYDAAALLAEETTVNKAAIRLYWGVIGLVSQWMGCSVDDLTIVVLLHELAHAYTQLGADIQGWRWPAPAFATSETAVKEGLAQYYTDRVLRRLGGRYPGALKTYEDMLRGHPRPTPTGTQVREPAAFLRRLASLALVRRAS